MSNETPQAPADIVSRLRSGVYGLNRIPLCAEAADEIERLRASSGTAKAPAPADERVSEIMRTIDAYAFDYKAEGKLAPMRAQVERELRAALAVAPPVVQAEPDAWQERQARRMRDGVVTEWSAWYPCKARSIEEARAEAPDHIPYEWRPLYATPPVAAAPDDYLESMYAFLQSTAPAGFADEVFRVVPVHLREAIQARNAVQGDEAGERAGLARQDSQVGCGVAGEARPVQVAVAAAPVVPAGWTIKRADSKPFKRIEVVAPNGYAACVDSMARNPENILYMLAEALLAATPVSAGAPVQSALGAPPSGSGSTLQPPAAASAAIPSAEAVVCEAASALYGNSTFVGLWHHAAPYVKARGGEWLCIHFRDFDDWRRATDALASLERAAEAIARGMEARQGRDPKGLDGEATTARCPEGTRPSEREASPAPAPQEPKP